MPGNDLIIAAAREFYGLTGYDFPDDADVYREYGGGFVGQDVIGADVEAIDRGNGKRVWLWVNAEMWAEDWKGAD